MLNASEHTNSKEHSIKHWIIAFQSDYCSVPQQNQHTAPQQTHWDHQPPIYQPNSAIKTHKQWCHACFFKARLNSHWSQKDFFPLDSVGSWNRPFPPSMSVGVAKSALLLCPILQYSVLGREGSVLAPAISPNDFHQSPSGCWASVCQSAS